MNNVWVAIMYYGNTDWVESGAPGNDLGMYHTAAWGNRPVAIAGTVCAVDGKGSLQCISEVVSFSTSASEDPGSCNDQVVDFQSNW
jgi:hypothetical protein